MTTPKQPPREVDRLLQRRAFIRTATTGTVVAGLCGGLYVLDDLLTNEAKAENRSDGRPRVPPGQRVLRALKPMGGTPGSPNPSDFSLTIHGDVERPMTLDFAGLLRSDNVELVVDVHCVTGWTVLGARFKGVRVRDLAERVGLKDGVKHVIFEGAHGYTANVRLGEALAPDVLVAHRLDGRSLARPHGAPVRAVIPSLYFWKSAKWLTGIRFVRRDEPGYWETRGYNNHADPWLEERYA